MRSKSIFVAQLFSENEREWKTVVTYAFIYRLMQIYQSLFILFSHKLGTRCTTRQKTFKETTKLRQFKQRIPYEKATYPHQARNWIHFKNNVLKKFFLGKALSQFP